MIRLLLIATSLFLFASGPALASMGFDTTFGTGTSDTVTSSANISIPTSASACMRLWVHGSGGSGGNPGFGIPFIVMDSGGTSQDFNIFMFNSATQMAFERGFSSVALDVDFTTPAAGQWFSLCLTYAATNTTNRPIVYVNGSTVTVNTDAAPTGTASTITEPIWIGNTNGATKTNIFDGQIADIAIWNVIITANDVLAYSKGTSPLQIHQAALVFYSPLYGIGNAAADWGPSHIALTTASAKIGATNPQFQPVDGMQ